MSFLDTLASPYFILPVVLWTLPWKGYALWKSARLNHKIWFVVLLVLNNLAILEILYIFVFSRMGKDKNMGKLNTKPVPDLELDFEPDPDLPAPTKSLSDNPPNQLLKNKNVGNDK